MLQTTEKQTAEAVIVQFDFGADMSTTEEISAVVTVIAENQGLVGGSSNVTCGSNTANGTIAQTLISGGTNLEQYKITCTVTTDGGQTLELECLLNVRDA